MAGTAKHTHTHNCNQALRPSEGDGDSTHTEGPKKWCRKTWVTVKEFFVFFRQCGSAVNDRLTLEWQRACNLDSLTATQ